MLTNPFSSSISTVIKNSICHWSAPLTTSAKCWATLSPASYRTGAYLLKIFIGSWMYVCLLWSYGRKSILIIGCLGSGIFGVLRAFSTNYYMFATFEFLDSLVGAAIYSTSYIIGLELVTPKLRTIFGTLLNCFYAVGEIFLGLFAMWLKDYKIVLLVSYAPAFLVIFYIWLLPQSEWSFMLVW